MRSDIGIPPTLTGEGNKETPKGSTKRRSLAPLSLDPHPLRLPLQNLLQGLCSLPPLAPTNGSSEIGAYGPGRERAQAVLCQWDGSRSLRGPTRPRAWWPSPRLPRRRLSLPAASRMRHSRREYEGARERMIAWGREKSGSTNGISPTRI